jgi:hypothetical protein
MVSGVQARSSRLQSELFFPSKATRGATLQLPPDCGGWRVGMRLVPSAGLWQKIERDGIGNPVKKTTCPKHLSARYFIDATAHANALCGTPLICHGVT